jgi:hypothetical protein
MPGGLADNPSWFQGQLAGTHRIAGQLPRADGCRGAGCREVLWSKTGLHPIVPDPGDAKGLTGDRRKAERRPEDLPASLAHPAVELDGASGFHARPSRTRPRFPSRRVISPK